MHVHSMHCSCAGRLACCACTCAACIAHDAAAVAAAFALQERVEKAGGQVLYWNGHRVMGVLAMSRAIGDHCLRPYVIPEPEVCGLA
jgi:protein phosphatase 2C